MIIDVGANHGDFAINIAKRNPGLLILAIEPIPELCEKLKESSAKDSACNLVIVQCAIDINERTDFFNVAAHHDWGVSSLLNFDDKKISNDDYWKTREDMFFNTRIAVEVKTLESVLDGINIKGQLIDFIKIDAQGLDLNVLRSAGKYIQDIQAGMLEVSISTDRGLYENETYDLRKALNWLDENGFKSYALKPNDPASNEYNLYFCKKGISAHQVENDFKLKNLDIYDGKFYWHYPSNELSFERENLKKTLQGCESTIYDLQKSLLAAEEKSIKNEKIVKTYQKKCLYILERKVKKALGFKDHFNL